MSTGKKVFIILSIAFTILFGVVAFVLIPNRKYSFPLDESRLDILVVGDSIFCNNIYGIPDLAVYLEEKTGCEIQNCSIGGTSASKFNKGNEIDYYADKLNFYNVANIICTGNASTVSDNTRSLSINFPDGYKKMLFLAGTDPAKEDVLIINYGINDAFMRVKCNSDDKYDNYTFGGAMRRGIEKISKKYPDLKIIVNEVNYATIIQVGEKDTDFDEITDQYRKEYNAELEKIASEYPNVYYFRFSDYCEVNDENYEEYLFDGIHYNEKGKEAYATALAEYIGGLN